jgi:hypothetical protein
MAGKIDFPEDFLTWDSAQVQSYFEKKLLPSEAWVENEINAERAILLTPDHVRKLDIPVVGHRVEVMQILNDMKKAGRKIQRKKQIAYIEEAYEGSPLSYNIVHCCGMFPRDPNKFTLLASELKIDDIQVSRCCGLRLPCGARGVKTDSIQLDTIRDVDTVTMKIGCCCCASDLTRVDVTTGAQAESQSDGARIAGKQLLFSGGDGDEFANTLMIAIEDYKLNFRLAGRDRD